MVEAVRMSDGTLHGTSSSYNNGCRCKACTRAIRNFRRDQRARKKGTKPAKLNTHDSKMNEITDLMVELGMAEYDK
jgi:hypothetical protein